MTDRKHAQRAAALVEGEGWEPTGEVIACEGRTPPPAG